MTRLSFAALDRLPDAVARPRFDPRALGIGIVHLGCGAFHRAHQAIYTQAAIGVAGGDWGILGVSLQSRATRDRLEPQDGLYSVIERGGSEARATVVGTLRGVAFAPESREAVIARIADPRTRIVSLTVTEKGYCHDPATGKIDERHPDVVHDLAQRDAPRSAPGLLLAGLAARRAGGAGPLAVLSCDNLPHNGSVTGGIVARLAELADPALARWIAANVAFPSTMVDRIVPATTEADVAEAARLLGFEDAAPVVAERFRQWVIEDAFPGGRPAWEAAGAELVADVAPFEAMKLRLLNGSHSTLAYLGALAGHEFVFEAIAAPGFRRLVDRVMEEAAPTLTMPPGVDLPAYRRALVERFADPAIRHRTAQIAIDGSQKLPQRLLAPIRENLAAGRSIDAAALAVAGWMRYVRGVDGRGRAFEIRDPLAREFAARADGTPAERGRALLGLGAVFGDDLPREPRFVAAVTRWLEALETHGAAAVVAAG